jgi:translation initiation factor IF-2
VSFLFVQAETSSNFEGGKIGTFGFGVLDFFRDEPKLKRNEKVAAAAEVMQVIYAKSSKFRRGIPVCKMFYVTTGKWTDDKTLEALSGKQAFSIHELYFSKEGYRSKCSEC